MSALLDPISFRLGILKQAILILFKRKKNIKLLQFNYVCDRESKNTIIVRYNFENVLWYEFDNRKTFSNRQVIYRPDTGEKELHLTVYGLFDKKKYTIVVQANKVSILGIINRKNKNRVIYDHAKIK